MVLLKVLAWTLSLFHILVLRWRKWSIKLDQALNLERSQVYTLKITPYWQENQFVSRDRTTLNGNEDNSIRGQK